MTGTLRIGMLASLALPALGLGFPRESRFALGFAGDSRTSTRLACLIREAHEGQRNLFETLHIETVCIKPQASLATDLGRLLQGNPLEVAAEDVAYRQDFQINALGHYSHQIQGFRLSQPTDGHPDRYLDTPRSTPYGSSLNGRVYRTLSPSGQARVYPAAHHPPDHQFTPRTLLHALFDRRLRAALEEPCRHTIGRTDAGLVQVLYQEDLWIYRYLIDPAEGYMVVRFQQIPVQDELSLPVYEHGISYRRTVSGFHCPTRAYVKRFDQLKLVTATTLCRVNKGPINTTLSFPLGIPVKNYTCGLETPVHYRSRTTFESYEDIADSAIWVISGVVVDAEHRPLANVPVKIHPYLPDGNSLPSSFIYNHLIEWDAITDEFGRFAIDLEKCSWQIYDSGDHKVEARHYKVVFLPDGAGAHIANGVQASEEPLCFRLESDAALFDSIPSPARPSRDNSPPHMQTLPLGRRAGAQADPVLLSYFY